METKPLNPSRRNLLKMTGVAAGALIVSPFPLLAGPTLGAKASSQSTVKLFFTESGAGENVMLLHGWSCDSNDWSWQLPLFKSKYRVVAVDLRGHGWSEVMPSGGYDPEDYVRDIESLITTHYPGQKFILIGHSMGGQIAARFAAKRPDLTKAVISVDGALGFSDELGSAFAELTRALQTEDPGKIVPPFFKQLYVKTTDPALEVWHARRVKGMSKTAARESFGPLFEGPDQVGVGQASAKFCKGLDMPFYHLCRDPAQADRMRPWFENKKSKVDVWKNTGHWIMQDRSDDLNTAITAWIAQL